jgi:hypothetical protein
MVIIRFLNNNYNFDGSLKHYDPNPVEVSCWSYSLKCLVEDPNTYCIVFGVTHPVCCPSGHCMLSFFDILLPNSIFILCFSIIGLFLTRIALWGPLVEQKIFTLPDPLSFLNIVIFNLKLQYCSTMVSVIKNCWQSNIILPSVSIPYCSKTLIRRLSHAEVQAVVC